MSFSITIWSNSYISLLLLYNNEQYRLYNLHQKHKISFHLSDIECIKYLWQVVNAHTINIIYIL